MDHMWCCVVTYDKDREPRPVPVPSGDGLPFGEIFMPYAVALVKNAET